MKRTITKNKIKNPIFITCICLAVIAGIFVYFFYFNKPDKKPDVSKSVEEIISSLTLEEKVAQLFIVTPEQLTPEYSPVIAAGDVTKKAVNKYPVGGIIYLGPNLVSPDQTKTMLDNVQKYSMERIGLPLFLCIDEEGGQVSRLADSKGFDLPVFDHMSDVGRRGNTEEAETIGKTIGSYLKEYGFNTDFAPVADVLLNNENQVVIERAFGENPEVVTKMAGSVKRGLESESILTTYKHFPGHGDTTADTHEGYAFSNKTKEELYDCELIPFIDGIKNNVPFIMAGHISFPNITGDDTPASLSKDIIEGILIKELGYKGIVITDALNMGAVTKEYSSSDAVVKAIEAGVDMILMPENFVEAYEGVLSAVKEGRITEDRIDNSLYKILYTKIMRL